MKNIILILFCVTFYLGLISSCGDKAFFPDAISNQIYYESGDILVLSGGTVARTATPFPLHQIVVFSSTGEYKGLAYRAPTGPFLMGMGITPDFSEILFTMDTNDQVMSYSIEEQSSEIYLVDATLTGATMRTMAVLSDNSIVVAESTTSIEKFDSNNVRVTAGFPFTVTANLMKLRRISGDRFAAVFTGGDDRPRIYNNAGALQSQVGGSACANNCDPTDIVELPDGRFVVSNQLAATHSLEIFSSTFVFLGRLYQDLAVLQNPSAMAVHPDGDLIVCSTTFNVCEKIRIDGITGTRVGTRAFIDNAGLIRQPTDILVVP